jgi:hypothetical protein
MIHKLFASAILTIAALTGFAVSPAAANEHIPFGPPHRIERDCERYEVLVRHRGCWNVYETFRDRDDARHAAWRLRHRGFEVEVRRV